MREEVTELRPQIGVTGPDHGGWAAWLCTKRAITKAGGKAVRITPSRPVDISQLQGLVLGGGADIDPSRYNATILATLREESRRARKINFAFVMSVFVWLLRRLLSAKSTRHMIDQERDDLEFGLLRECTEREIPVLGICRGGQLINVFWGGTLYQNISCYYVEKPQLRTIRPRKLIHIESGTTLARILGKSQAKVNSLHDQSVKDVGHNLRVAARESNGVIQAIEHQSLPFMMGVQWHPEFLPFIPEQQRFFHHLVQAAKVYAYRASQPAKAGGQAAHLAPLHRQN